MSFQLRPFIRHGLCGLGAVLCVTQAALADDHRGARVPLLPAYQQECSACHVAYPPGMLPAASWRRIMNDLSHHYGTDASLDPATVKQISVWLDTYAGTYKRVREEPPQDRITRSAWFIRKHDEVPASVWTRPSVRSASNCAACHTQANQGAFNEHDIRIPR